MTGSGVQHRLVAGAAVLAILSTAALASLRAARSADRASGPRSTCTSRLLADWSDGRIDGTYPITCYRDALESLPADLRIYSSAPDDIAQALSQRIVNGAASKTSRPRDARTVAGTATKR